MPRSFGTSGYNLKSPPLSFGSSHLKSPSSFNNYSKSPSSSFGNSYIRSPPSGNNLKSPPSSFGTSPTFRKTQAMMAHRTPNEGPIVSPSRQPKGPDGTNGFSSEYRELRIKKASLTEQAVPSNI